MYKPAHARRVPAPRNVPFAPRPARIRARYVRSLSHIHVVSPSSPLPPSVLLHRSRSPLLPSPTDGHSKAPEKGGTWFDHYNMSGFLGDMADADVSLRRIPFAFICPHPTCARSTGSSHDMYQLITRLFATPHHRLLVPIVPSTSLFSSSPPQVFIISMPLFGCNAVPGVPSSHTWFEQYETKGHSPKVRRKRGSLLSGRIR